MQLYINGIGLFAPGLAGWQNSRDVFTGSSAYDSQITPKLTGEFLPPTERRRAGKCVKLSLEVAHEAIAQSGTLAQDAATVFASSGGDTEVIHQICETLASSDRMISPMRFHNSVHNAAAGYWSIATGSHQPSTSLSYCNDTFSAGLLEAAAQAIAEQTPVLLVVYDMPYPEPIHSVRPICAEFGTAMLICPVKSASSLVQLSIHITQQDNTPLSTMKHAPDLEILRNSNPAARALPLLQAIAENAPASIVFKHVGNSQLHVALTPCR